MMNTLFKTLIYFACLGYTFGYAIDRPLDGHMAIISKSQEEVTAWKLDLLNNAQRRIYMMGGYTEGVLLKRVLSIFEQNLSQKPQLEIWFFSSEFPTFDTDEAKLQMNYLEALYPSRFHFLSKPASANYKQEEGVFNTENHIKLLIVDEKYTLLGGTNLIDSLSRTSASDDAPPSFTGAFTPKASLDQDIILIGPLALTLKDDFFRVWGMYEENQSFQNSLGEFYPQKITPPQLKEEERGVIPFYDQNPDIHPARAKALLAGPRVNIHGIQNEYAKAIDSAKKEIQLGQLYFFPVPQIYNRLLAAANRNIDIKAMTNGFWKKLTLSESALWLFVQRSRVHYFPLMMGRHFSLIESVEARLLPQKNVQLFELNENYVMYHKKVMTVDGKTSLIGSFNFGQKSAFADYEALAVVDSIETASGINANLAQDRKKGTLIERDVAYAWYYSPYYATAALIEGFFADGNLLSMKKPPKPKFPLEPTAGEMESFLLSN